MQATPPAQPAQDAPSGPSGSQQSPAAQAIQMIEQGYQGLGKLIQSAGGQLPPQTIKLFQTAVQATDALLQDLTGPANQQQDTPPSPGGPMPANANSQARPAGPQ